MSHDLEMQLLMIHFVFGLISCVGWGVVDSVSVLVTWMCSMLAVVMYMSQV